MKLLTFNEALDLSTSSTCHVLLGNGFSIAWKADVFSYNSLLEQADFSKTPNAKKLFEVLGSNDFEVVIRILNQATKLLPVYLPKETKIIEKIKKEADELKNILVEAIASNHPDLPNGISNESYKACREFLHKFDHIYTVNYDILLYWTLMHQDVDKLKFNKNDGFANPDLEEETDYVSWEDHQNAKVHYLHGALHLFDSGERLKKYTWSRTAIPLMDQIRYALKEDLFPLFVAEGHSSSKLDKINHSAYLHKALRSFSNIGGDLFIFGHSLAENDSHILRKIEVGKINKVFISIFGDVDSIKNKEIFKKAQLMRDQRKQLVDAGKKKYSLEVHFFSAESAKIWG